MSVMCHSIDMCCDDCGEWRRVPDGTTPAIARRYLRAKGWLTRAGGKDYCPNCRDKHLPQNLKRTNHV